MTAAPTLPGDDYEYDDPGMAAVLSGAHGPVNGKPHKRSHEDLVTERLAWHRANQEARDVLAVESAKAVANSSVERSGWVAIDLDPFLDNQAPIVLPEIGRRHDGVKLLYRGKEHAVASEPECGKTWFALMQVAEELKAGARVVYVDFEDDERTIVGRLKTIGVLASRLRKAADQFRYIRPEGPHQIEWLRDLFIFGDKYATLVIYDGVTEGMQLWGLDPLSQIAAAEWRRLLVKPALLVGAATLSTDHVVKALEARGRYAIGAQHKMAGLTGVQFLMEQVKPFGRGLKGVSRILVSKDRNGGLRQHGEPVEGKPGITYMGDLVGDAVSGEMESLIFWPPRDGDAEDASGEPVPDVQAAEVAKVRAQILKILAARGQQGFNDINSRVHVSASKVREALAAMEDDGEILVEPGPNRGKLHSLTPAEGVPNAA